MAFTNVTSCTWDVPSSWLLDQDLSICTSRHQLVSNSRTVSHRCCCRFRANTPDEVLPPTILWDNSTTSHSLPYLEEVFQLRCHTLHFVPARSRPAFARMLAGALRSVVRKSMAKTAKVCTSFKKGQRQSSHFKHTLINFLCDLWSKNKPSTLWNLAKGRAVPVTHGSHQCHEYEKRQLESVVSMARAGLFGKASHTPVFWTSSQYGCHMAAFIILTLQLPALL